MESSIQMVGKRMLVIGIISYVIIFFLYYPPIFAFRDEASYLSMAYVLRKGAIFIENTNIPFNSIVKSKGHLVPFYPLGQSILLMPLTFFGWRSVFVTGIIFHLLGALFFLKLIRLFRVENSFFALLYLFFPAFIFYSRTIMCDIPSTTLLLMAYYFYFKHTGSKFISGLFFGIATLIRFTNILLILPFLIISIIKAIKNGEYRKTVDLSLGVAPFILLTAILNFLYYGSPFLTGYSKVFTGSKLFSPTYFLHNIQHYSVSFMLSYPFMLISFFFAKKTKKPEVILSIILFFLLYSLYYFHDRFPNGFLTYIFGIRFLFPVIPLILLLYAEFLNKILRRFSQAAYNLTVSFILIFLVISCIVVNHQHQQFLRGQLALRDTIYKSTEESSVIIYDGNTAELLQKVWGDRIYIRYEGYENLLEHLKRIATLKNIYLVKRDVIYANKDKIEGLPEQEIAKIKQHYGLEKIAQKDGLEVFRLII